MPLMAHLDFMMTGNATLFLEFGQLLRNSTQINCIHPSTDLVDFTSCTRMNGTSDIVDWPQSQRDGYVLSNTSTVIQAFAVAGMLALAEMANATGQNLLCAELTAQAEKTSAAVNALLWDAKTGLYVDGLEGQAAGHSAWHANAYPLWAGIVPTGRKASVLAFLKSKRMAGSVYGALPFLLGLYNVPSNGGEFALEMLTSCDRHSWCHMLTVGATATMEAWSRGDKPNLSWSQCVGRLELWLLCSLSFSRTCSKHPFQPTACPPFVHCSPAGTTPVIAIAAGLMGLRPLQQGWRSVMFRPQPGNLSQASLTIPTVRGSLFANISQSSERFDAFIAAPASSSVHVCLPSMGDRASLGLTVDGQRVAGVVDETGDFVCAVWALNGGSIHSISRDGGG